jgi:molybdate transport system substrate-binding protein
MRLAAYLLLVLAIAGCGSSAEGSKQPTVYAASSLRDALPAFDGKATYNFAGSDQLQLQIEHGAPADVFASASPKQAQALYSAGRCTEPRTFATNRLALLVPAASGITTVDALRSGHRRLAIGSTGLPVGDYTRQVLQRLNMTSLLSSNTISDEVNVAGITAKVAAGSADAGFAYVTDARAAGDRVRLVELPASAQPTVLYQACAVKRDGETSAAGQRWLNQLTGPDARSVLKRFGFGLPPRG